MRREIIESDETLWRRSLDGDGEAFGMLFDRHRDRVFAHACRLADTRHDAEDITGSAFLELWRRRSGVRMVDGTVLPWLLVTTTNLARNSRRGVRRYRQLLDRLPRETEGPDTAVVALEGHALGADPRLKDALRSLKTKDAQLFALVALEDYPVAAAAEQLKLSEQAARIRLHRIRTNLRQQLGERFVSDDPPGGR